MDAPTSPAAVALYWIPLGAGDHSVRFNGRVFEALVAARERRPWCDLYHAALVMESGGDRYGIEVAPSPDADEASRGVVAMGAVGSRPLGRLRLFRYGGSVMSEAAHGARGVTALVYVASFNLDIGESTADLAAKFPGGELGPALDPVRPRLPMARPALTCTSSRTGSTRCSPPPSRPRSPS